MSTVVTSEVRRSGCFSPQKVRWNLERVIAVLSAQVIKNHGGKFAEIALECTVFDLAPCGGARKQNRAAKQIAFSKLMCDGSDTRMVTIAGQCHLNATTGINRLC